MKLTLKRQPQLINLTLKIVSLIFGYLFWLILAQSQNTNLNLDVPIYFYGLNEKYQVEAPEKLNITISGKRCDVCNLECSQLSAHFDISNYINCGQYKMNSCNADIFLQKKFKMLDYSPKAFDINIKEKK